MITLLAKSLRHSSIRIASLNYTRRVLCSSYSRPPIGGPPGYVNPQMWNTQRPETDRGGRGIYNDGQRLVDASKDYFASRSCASISGKPVDSDFSYPVVDEIGNIDNLDFKLRDNLAKMGMQHLTPVQRHSIGLLGIDSDQSSLPDDAPIVGEYDLMAAAQTGSGKTLAYLIPLFNRLLRIYPQAAMQSVLKEQRAFPSGIILVPTRELAQQITQEAVKLSSRTFVRAVALYGGERPSRQMFEVGKGCHIIIATPGRLIDFCEQELVSLKHCRSLIFDEADRMLDMGFERDMRKITENPAFNMPPPRDSERQTALFSATFPREVTMLARNFLRGPKCISLTLTDPEGQVGAVVPEWGKNAHRSSQDSVQTLARIIPREIKQSVHVVNTGSLTDYLVSILGKLKQSSGAEPDSIPRDNESKEKHRVLIFCNTKVSVDRIDSVLYRSGLRSAAIHGDKAQFDRTKTLQLFRSGEVEVLVASSVAARGIDIPNVKAVINIGLPVATDDYVHRVGRTGRMGRSGEAITIVTARDLESSSNSVAHNICKLIHTTTGSIEAIPQDFLRFARYDGGADNQFEEDDFEERKRSKPRSSSSQWSVRNERYPRGGSDERYPRGGSDERYPRGGSGFGRSGSDIATRYGSHKW